VGARFLLEGSVRKSGPRVRITLHLIDAAAGAELWSDRVEDANGDVFALQDQVAERVAGVTEMAVTDADTQMLVDRPTTNLGSYDLYLRALFLFRTSRKAEMLQAIELLDRAVALDPTFALALSQNAVCLRQVVDHSWADDLDGARRKGLDQAERALRAAAADARVLAQVAISLPGLEGRTDRALTLVERAKALNPSSGFAWLASGSLQLRRGDPQQAAADLETAMRLDPISSMNNYMRMYLASARFQQRRFEEALALFHSTTYRLPVSYAILASLHGHLGQAAEARRALADLERVEAGSLDALAGIWFPRPEYRQLLLDGLTLAEQSQAAG
jgi:adenylate cyclase